MKFGYKFVCSKCQGHTTINYTHNYIVVVQLEETVYCKCKAREHLVAATRQGSRKLDIRELGRFEGIDPVVHHRVTTRVYPSKQLDSVVTCKSCYNQSTGSDWELTQEHPVVDETSHIFSLSCASCGEKINDSSFIWKDKKNKRIRIEKSVAA